MMHFAAWPYLYLMALIPALLGLYAYAFARKRRDLVTFMALELVPQLLPGYSRIRQWIKALCVIGAVACLVLALMQPQWGAQWQNLPRQGRDLILLLDVSHSMRAQDALPDRLERAQIGVAKLVQLLQDEGGHRLGLVTFAGRARLMCPPTLDYAFFLERIKAVSPDSVLQEGTSIGDAIRQVLNGFGALDREYTDLILITDGEDHGSAPLEAAQAAAQHHVTLYTIGVGDAAQGAPIPVADQEGGGLVYAQYRGQMVRSRMQQSLLIEMAQQTGGVYVPARADALGLERLYRNHIALKPRRDIDVARYERPVPQYRWFVVGALLLLMLEMLVHGRRTSRETVMTRSGMIAGILIMPNILLPQLGLTASPYQSIQQGNALYHAGQYEAAAKSYAEAAQVYPEAAEIHFNQGNAFYKQQQYKKALQHYTQALHAAPPGLAGRITYNLGNVAYQRALAEVQNREHALKHLRAAITYYRDSLRIDAQQHGARYNLELAHRLQRQLLQQRQPQLQREIGQSQPQPSKPPDPQSSQSTASGLPDKGEAGAENIAIPEALSPEEAERQLEAIRSRAREMAKLRRQWQRARLRDARHTNKYW